MVEFHEIIKSVVSEKIEEYTQTHIYEQIKRLFDNSIKQNYDDSDIINLIENIHLNDLESDE